MEVVYSQVESLIFLILYFLYIYMNMNELYVLPKTCTSRFKNLLWAMLYLGEAAKSQQEAYKHGILCKAGYTIMNVIVFPKDRLDTAEKCGVYECKC